MSTKVPKRQLSVKENNELSLFDMKQKMHQAKVDAAKKEELADVYEKAMGEMEKQNNRVMKMVSDCYDIPFTEIESMASMKFRELWEQLVEGAQPPQNLEQPSPTPLVLESTIPPK